MFALDADGDLGDGGFYPPPLDQELLAPPFPPPQAPPAQQIYFPYQYMPNNNFGAPPADFGAQMPLPPWPPFAQYNPVFPPLGYQLPQFQMAAEVPGRGVAQRGGRRGNRGGRVGARGGGRAEAARAETIHGAHPRQFVAAPAIGAAPLHHLARHMARPVQPEPNPPPIAVPQNGAPLLGLPAQPVLPQAPLAPPPLPPIPPIPYIDLDHLPHGPLPQPLLGALAPPPAAALPAAPPAAAAVADPVGADARHRIGRPPKTLADYAEEYADDYVVKDTKLFKVRADDAGVESLRCSICTTKFNVLVTASNKNQSIRDHINCKSHKSAVEAYKGFLLSIYSFFIF